MPAMRAASMLLSTGLLASTAMAQLDDYKVWSSFVYLSAGDSTPSALGTPVELTALGAQQMYAAGQYLRSQYLASGASTEIASLNADEPGSLSFVSTLDDQYTSASTQAFLQGMWPPTTSSSTVSTLANGTTISGPLGGMQYAAMTSSNTDAVDAIYVAGHESCRGLSDWGDGTTLITNLVEIDQESTATYFQVQSLLDPAMSDSEQTILNAKPIYDYLAYMAAYNASVSAQLDRLPGVLDRLRYYADVQQTAYYGSLDAVNPYGRVPSSGSASSISTIAGSTLASAIVAYFDAFFDSPSTSSPISAIVGDYPPMLSFFAISSLTSASSNFSSIPLPGSAMVLELVSASTNAISLPTASALGIRFRFRNGTGIEPPALPSGGGEMQTFSLFNTGDDVMPLTTFLASLSPYAIADPGDWCYQCAASAGFCAQWNDSLVDPRYAHTANNNNNNDHSGSDARSSPSPAALVVAGVVGAAIALAVMGAVAAAAVWCCGLRTTRSKRGWFARRRGHGPVVAAGPEPAAVAGAAKRARVVEAEDETEGDDAAWEMKAPLSPRGAPPAYFLERWPRAGAASSSSQDRGGAKGGSVDEIDHVEVLGQAAVPRETV